MAKVVTKGNVVMDETVLMSLILDKDMVVTDAPCAGATLIAQYSDGYVALAVTAGGTWVFGREGGQPISIGISDLLKMLEAKRENDLQ
jgi:hypothetical protein